MNFEHRIVVAMGLALLPAAASAAALDVKTGLWEATTTIETSGAPPMDLSRLPPEQRARLEAALKKQEAQGPHKHSSVVRNCVTQEQLSRQPFDELGSKLQKQGETCKTTVVSATSKHWQGKFECTGKTAISGELSIDALSRERVRGEARSHASNDAHAMSSHVTISARWLGADCGKQR